MGPAIATQILLNSDLKNRFDLIHFNNTINRTIDTQGKAGISKIFRSIGMYFSFFKVVRAETPNLILIPISQATIGFLKDVPFILIAKLFDNKVVIQLRGSNLKTWLARSSAITRKIFSKTIGGTHGVIVLGEKLRYLFEDYFPSKKIFVAPNGGEYSFPQVKRSANSPLSILYLANLYESKGARVLLDAALSLKDERIRFRFAGGWRNDHSFRQKFETDAMADHIELNPPVSGNAKFEMFAKADIFVFPPIMPEGHPWVLVEAMAAGLPIIATDQGAITESVIDGLNGFIVDSGRPDQIVEKLLYLNNNPNERKRMASASRTLYEQRFTAEKLADNYSDIFNTVINQN